MDAWSLNYLRRVLAITALCGVFSTQLEAEEVTHTYGGLTINGNLEQAEEHESFDGVVLITHGTLAHNRMEIVATSQDLLAENGVSSLAINLSLGIDDRHGMYDCTEPHRHLLTDGVMEIAAWVEWLKTRNTRGVVLMGHSSAANLALVAATEHEDPIVVGVILLAASTAGYDRYIANYETRYQVEIAGVLARAKALVNNGRGDELMEDVDFLFCPRTRVTAAAFLDHYRPNPIRANLSSFLERVKKPTLVIAAGEDEIQPNIPEYVKPYVDGKRVRLAIVDEAGHFFRDLNLEDAIDEAVAFVQDLQ